MKYWFSILFFIVYGYSFSQNDTINRVDDNNKKTGYWIIYGKDKPGYEAFDILEEGQYLDGRKVGKWLQYYPKNKIKAEIYFTNGRPMGKFKLYYENGSLEETGNWNGNGYVDSFLRYYPDRTLAQQRFFNANRKSQGWQYWYGENGNLELKFYAHNGREIADSGIVGMKSENVVEYPHNKMYPALSNEDLCLCNVKEVLYPYKSIDENGDSVVSYSTSYYFVKLVGKFRSSRLYNGTCYLEVNSEQYNLYVKPVENGRLNYSSRPVTQTEKKEELKFIKQYNSNKQIEYDGYFEDGKLYEGKNYIYDENGILIKIKVYKSGEHVGYAPLK